MTVIGIDPGVNTGIAIWREGALLSVRSTTIVEAMEIVYAHHERGDVLVVFEDARKRTWFGKKGREALQGAGSIKRDCQIWETFLTRHAVPYRMTAPANNKTKLDAAKFKAITGWPEQTNEHGRDAAMLVFGMK